MGEFLSAEEQTLESKTVEGPIDADQPLRHPDVVGVLGLAHESGPAPGHRAPQAVDWPAIGRDRAQFRSTVRDQAKTHVRPNSRGGRTKNRADKVVVEERRS